MEANTDLGQHFMTDKALLKRMVEIADLNIADELLEIGPGLGALTVLLQGKTTHFTTVDIDERFPATLHGNILDLIETISYDTVVSNLPYHISEPLFIKFAFFRPKKIVVVVGEQFAQHLQKETILGEVFRDIYTVTIVETISPESFSPPPKVMSALILCELKETIGPLADFYAYPKSKVKNYLKTRGKKLTGAQKENGLSCIKTTKREAQEFINKLPVLLQEKRLYELNKKEFIELKKVIRTM